MSIARVCGNASASTRNTFDAEPDARRASSMPSTTAVDSSSMEEFAVAMGFDGTEDLHYRSLRIRAALIAHEALEPMDWARALLATELAFASDVVGSGYEWSTTTGWSDETTVRVLRSTQLKLIRTVAPLVGRTLGTRPPLRPAIS